MCKTAVRKATVNSENWVRCKRCGHKMMRVISAGVCDPAPTVEIKCSSCKTLNVWTYDRFRVPNEEV